MAEAVGVGVHLVKNSTYLFQFLLDALAAVVLGILFYQRTACKAIYTVSVVAVTAAVFFLYTIHSYRFLYRWSPVGRQKWDL